MKTFASRVSLSTFTLFAALFAGTILLGYACGGSSSSSGGSNAVAVCEQGCTRLVQCNPTILTQTKCNDICAQASDCTNATELVTQYKNCEAMTACADFTSCVEGVVSACTMGTGGTNGGTGGTTSGSTGGTTGTGGVSGPGAGGSTGAGGSGDLSANCAALQSCCANPTNANTQTACAAAASYIASGSDAECMQALSAARSANLCP